MEEDQSQDKNEFVDFNRITEYVGIKNEYLFIQYLKEIFKDLKERDEQTKRKGITKMTFFSYIKLPMFISEKVFNSFDEDRDNILNPNEFIYGMKKLYNGTFEQSVQTVFNLLDFNKDSIIEKDDVRIMLSYLPLKTDKTSIEYKYQMESLEQIDEILELTFGNKTKLNLKEFIEIVEKRKSDVFLQILCFLYQKKPFNEENINALKDSSKNVTKNLNNNYNNNEKNKLFTPQTDFKITSPSEGKLIPSPNLKVSLSPASIFLNNNNFSELKNKYELNTFNVNETQNTPEVSGLTGMIRFHNENIINDDKIVSDSNNVNVNEILKNSQNFFISPSQVLIDNPFKDSTEEEELVEFTLETIEQPSGKESKNTNKIEDNKEQINVNNSNNKINENTNKGGNISSIIEKNNNDNTTSNESEIIYENYVYKLASDNRKLKKFYIVLIGQDTYYYKNNKKLEVLGIHNLSGCFVKDNGIKYFNNTPFYSFIIIFPSKEKVYYCQTEEIKENFLKSFKKSFGYLNFFDYYEMLDTIGEGIFGVIKLGLYKKNKERVAIKIITKKITKPNEIELVRTEIDIMKLCRHPNIVKLLDHFENADYIFIVMEYIQGGDLMEYMKKENFNFTEKRAAEIIYQIASGLKYLQKFGIIHRDLKPDNIMLTECNSKGKVKIMDFGLSKILGSYEKSIDGCGTLNYVAPEVLIRKPYNKEVDIWSLGVILYLMLSGKLPFSNELDDEKTVAQKTVYNPVEFPKVFWNNRSELVIDLIKKCLTKRPDNRITIDDILSHQWIKQFA